jgi:hypothetical protein
MRLLSPVQRIVDVRIITGLEKITFHQNLCSSDRFLAKTLPIE